MQQRKHFILFFTNDWILNLFFQLSKLKSYFICIIIILHLLANKHIFKSGCGANGLLSSGPLYRLSSSWDSLVFHRGVTDSFIESYSKWINYEYFYFGTTKQWIGGEMKSELFFKTWTYIVCEAEFTICAFNLYHMLKYIQFCQLATNSVLFLFSHSNVQ